MKVIYKDSWGMDAIHCDSELYKQIAMNKSMKELQEDAISLGKDRVLVTQMTDEQIAYFIYIERSNGEFTNA